MDNNIQINITKLTFTKINFISKNPTFCDGQNLKKNRNPNKFKSLNQNLYLRLNKNNLQLKGAGLLNIALNYK